MEHRFVILPEKKLIFQHFSRTVSLEDLVRALKWVVSDPLYNPTFNGLTIMTDAQVALTTTGVKHYASWFKKELMNSSGLGKLALLVDKPSHTALSQIFQFELSDFQNIQVFNTCEGACGWLNLDGAIIYDELSKLKKAEPVLY